MIENPITVIGDRRGARDVLIVAKQPQADGDVAGAIGPDLLERGIQQASKFIHGITTRGT